MSQRCLEPVLPVPDSNILNHFQVKYPDFGAGVCMPVREREREKGERERIQELKAASQRSGKPASVS